MPSADPLFKYHNTKYDIRAVIIWEHDQHLGAWVAIGLEQDIGAQGKDIKTVIERFDMAVEMTYHLVAKENSELPGASPDCFHRWWDDASDLPKLA